jgi:hypothetical protein
MSYVVIELKLKKSLLVAVAIVLIFVFLWTYFFWYPQLVLDQRIEELKKEGITVKTISYDIFYLDRTSTSSEVIFEQKQSWSDFKQDVITTKSELGSVDVFVDPDSRTFVFSRNNPTHYYYYRLP